ncbi:RNA polymerase subunit sigma [Chitinophaga varians]|uniref:RNA polymerase subunit sigma n=2 Tax=Chitinophaga varians TaxID=2202339 RepID=A0A847RU21_9BACT|nr:RNA polymerase subunit sigma [Chitinophaga varians]
MQQQELIPHLFRTEFSKISAVLCKYFGIEHIELAEDIASETFLLAMETWSYKGIPENPTAWLYVVAKNKARNYFARAHMFREKILPELKQTAAVPAPEPDLSDQNISDSLLQMLFAICHPVIPAEAQIGLALRILCGFGIDEIANAFLSNKETINKRLFRAREKLRTEKIAIEMPATAEIPQRLNAVLTTLYLLYNEGYYSESQDAVVREELCIEAIRLTKLLLNNPLTNTPAVNALMALMCFHASRLPARKDENGALILYQDQDEALWNRELISEGAYYLHEASQGSSLSRYHLEATIAWWHTIKEDTPEKWDNILHLYNRLLQLEYSPVAALNRTFALSKVKGNAAALPEAEKLGLSGNPYYHTLLGELYHGIDNQQALQHLQQALHLSKTQPEKQTIQQKIDHLPIT